MPGTENCYKRTQRPHLQPGTLEGRRTGKAPRKSLCPVVACGEGGSPRSEWSAGGGGQEGRGVPRGADREEGPGLGPEVRWPVLEEQPLETSPSLTLPLTHQSRCSGVTSSSVALTLLLQAGGRDCKTPGRCQPETGSRHDSTSSPNLTASQHLPILRISRFQELL